jgi:MarR family transcriptional regulator, 2-MHQ and catechol-resistance regulon repressor
MDTNLLLVENPSFKAWWFLARAYHSIAASLTRLFEDHGITGAQFGVLRCLSDADPDGLMLSDLSKRLMVTCGNTTGVVDRLEQAGYLRRVRPAGDRRVVLAQLTAEGEELYRRIIPGHQRLLGELLAGLAPEEREILSTLCERLHLSLEGGGEAPRAAAGMAGRER